VLLERKRGEKWKGRERGEEEGENLAPSLYLQFSLIYNRVYGTNTATSDWDFIVVAKKRYKHKISNKNILILIMLH
jgi:hypothetical protein